MLTGVITSWALQQTGTGALGIGYVDSASGVIPGMPANTVEIKPVLWGDTGLAGTVGFNDFTRMTQHYAVTGGVTWIQGDFNYDGSVNSADFGKLSPSYGIAVPFFNPVEVKTVAQLPAAAPAANPSIETPITPANSSAPGKKATRRAAKHIEVVTPPAKPAKAKTAAKKK